MRKSSGGIGLWGRRFIIRVMVLSGMGYCIVSERGGWFGSTRLAVEELLVAEFASEGNSVTPSASDVGAAKVVAKCWSRNKNLSLRVYISRLDGC